MVKISLFGLPGTGTSSVGKELSKKLNLTFSSSGDLFREMAKKKGLTLAEFGTLCEENSQIDRELDQKITTFGKENDNFVFDSRLAWYTIPQSFKIKLECDEEEQIRRIIEREGGEFEDVSKKTKERETSERKRYLQYYNIKNYMDDSHFDLIIDTTNLNIDQVVKTISDNIEKK